MWYYILFGRPAPLSVAGSVGRSAGRTLCSVGRSVVGTALMRPLQLAYFQNEGMTCSSCHAFCFNMMCSHYCLLIVVFPSPHPFLVSTDSPLNRHDRLTQHISTSTSKNIKRTVAPCRDTSVTTILPSVGCCFPPHPPQQHC